ncbi:hypothetical protein C0Q44_28050 [Paenibacillus sp. PCH8]|uniref:hypothetical protein n=1 Tax=Paenibacillus sp. PCH8 TaxID=2066524 RepID=UPI000CF844E2|nr:hypothetical protein [Paenibacillus sp. PCH8]PQP80270.1 hypothetical protein C0Q44_28050 [Paenibacillus sp. PCH8]
MDKEGLWLVYDNEMGLICIGDYDLCNAEYKRYVIEAKDFVGALDQGIFIDTTVEGIHLARVEKKSHIVEMDKWVYEWKEENYDSTPKLDNNKAAADHLI